MTAMRLAWAMNILRSWGSGSMALVGGTAAFTKAALAFAAPDNKKGCAIDGNIAFSGRSVERSVPQA